MHKTHSPLRGLLAATLVAAGLAPSTTLAQEPAAASTAAAVAPATTLKYSNKWRFQVSEGANNDGVMRFRVTPKDGTPIDIPVSLKKGRGEDGCARDIRDTFKKAIDASLYKVELDDGEDVLVKVRKGPGISIELVESTVEGTRINFDRE